jgi:EAL domain-containing protein (putative c-di-GMP-specific phosphodiesterase class I)
MMRKAIHSFADITKELESDLKLSMNLAIKQLESEDFIEFITDLLEQSDVNPNSVEFEITESQIMQNPEKSIVNLKILSDLGISIAVDDFGTGYSSLAYLKRLPINKLKIDREFVSELPSDSEDVAITKTIVSLCENLNLNVIAEGVETKEQVEFLVEHGCSDVQGYYYSRPIDCSKFCQELKGKFS